MIVAVLVIASLVLAVVSVVVFLVGADIIDEADLADYVAMFYEERRR